MIPVFEIHLTNSQRMALLDILTVYSLLQHQPQTFVDVVGQTTTTTGGLVQLLMAAEVSNDEG